MSNLATLALLVRHERDTLLAQWRQQVRRLPSARELDTPTLNDHIPALLDELAAALESNSNQTIPEALAEGSPPVHGLQRLQDGYDIEEVVAEYNILRGGIHDLADRNGVNLQGKAFHIINRVFDHAIGLALQTYATQQAADVKRRREDYLAFVAHDLRTPLNAIAMAQSALQCILGEEGRNTETAQMLNTLRRNIQHLGSLVEKVLEENMNLQAETGINLVRREFDLWPLVEALIHDLHPVAGTHGTKLTNNVLEDLVVYADANLLRRIFQNLIANAIQHTPRGEVVIGARVSDENSAVECWVCDNGKGIPLPLLDKVFDKGETEPQNERGVGLGLAIVKTFTEAHGGQVTVESREGEGTTFRFSLPLEPDRASPR